MIRKPKSTEKAIRIIEIDNTLVFEVDKKDKKEEIKKELEDMFKIKVEKVNVLTRGNKKIVYIKLNKKNPAIDIATKLGMI